MDVINYLWNKKPLFLILKFILPISLSLHRRLEDFIIRLNHSEKHLLLREDEVSRYMYVICSGSDQAFYQNDIVRRHNNWLMTTSYLTVLYDQAFGKLSFAPVKPAENITVGICYTMTFFLKLNLKP